MLHEISLQDSLNTFNGAARIIPRLQFADNDEGEFFDLRHGFIFPLKYEQFLCVPVSYVARLDLALVSRPMNLLNFLQGNSLTASLIP